MLQSEIAPTFGSAVGARDKIEKYGWKIKDSPGMFANIDKTLLNVDGGPLGYQRRLYLSKSRAIARDWSWLACGCLIVVRRPDGSFWIIDGQHRHDAAMKRSDIRELPCIVFELADVSSEAKGFVDVNVNRKPLSALDRYRALLMQGDPAAVAAEAFSIAAGRKVKSGAEGDALECVGTIMACINEDADSFQRISPILINLCRGHTIHRDLVEGMFYIERKMIGAGASLSEPFWTKRVLSIGRDELMSRGRKMREAVGKGGAAVTARGFAMAITARMRRPLPGFANEAG